MSWKRYCGKIISEIYSLKTQITGNRPGFRILMYHSVRDGELYDKSLDPNGIFTVKPKMFKTQVEQLKYGNLYTLASLSCGLGLLGSNREIVAITFDDGYKDNLYFVAPLLVESGIPFTVFVTTDLSKNNKKDILQPLEIRELSKMPGVEIGSHGVTHRRLKELDDTELIDELVTSKKYLEDIIGKEVTSMSYPHGSFDKRVQRAVGGVGYKIAANSYFSLNNISSNHYSFARTSIWSDDTIRTFSQKLCGGWDWYCWR
jgi:peptidoglycan/xylan/chitin deacetylase (PgdA/CDA1 family)